MEILWASYPRPPRTKKKPSRLDMHDTMRTHDVRTRSYVGEPCKIWAGVLARDRLFCLLLVGMLESGSFFSTQCQDTTHQTSVKTNHWPLWSCICSSLLLSNLSFGPAPGKSDPVNSTVSFHRQRKLVSDSFANIRYPQES